MGKCLSSTLFASLLLVWGQQALCQIVNTGKLYVSVGTEFSLGADFQNMTAADLVNDGRLYAYGNFANQGLVDFIDESAQVHFLAGSPQEIEGTDVEYSRFSNIYFGNEDGFNLDGEIRVDGTAYFNGGVIDGSGFLFFGDGASSVGASNISYANMTVQKDGGDSFEFPVGDGGYFRPLLLEGIEDVSESFRARYFFETPDELYPLGNLEDDLELIGGTEYWQLDRVTGSSPVTLTLGWDESTTSSELWGDGKLDAIRIVHWDTVSNQWVDIGGVVDMVARTVSVPALSQFGIFALARTKVDEEVVLTDDLIFNGVSPNGDGFNDYFYIEDIEEMPNNMVQIYNRWSIKVFETREYDSSGNVFNGFAETGMTFGGARLPGGTYYYVISYDSLGDDGKVNRISKMGFLYLNY